MTNEIYVKARSFQCDCGWPYHSLHVGPFDPQCEGVPMDDWELYHPLVTFTIVIDGGDNGWRERVRAAWALLRGRVYPLTEVIIHRDDWPEFVAHIRDINDASDIVRARYYREHHERIQAQMEEHDDRPIHSPSGE